FFPGWGGTIAVYASCCPATPATTRPWASGDGAGDDQGRRGRRRGGHAGCAHAPGDGDGEGHGPVASGAARPGSQPQRDHRALHTPGHASNHLCYLLEQERILFSGDHVMNGSTVVIAPPDGEMAAYVEALRALRSRRPPLRAIAPGHGPLIDDPKAKLEEYLAHRAAREEAIAGALQASGQATVDELVGAVYTDVPPSLHPLARHSVWAHLRKLTGEGRAFSDDPDDLGATWSGDSS